VISLTAFLLGVTGAYLHVFLAPDLLFKHALMGWAVLYPNFQLKPVIHPYQLAVLFFLTVVPYTMMTIIPTWKVAITDPDTVMRQA
jgi:ABC-type lipoprotein release transport system permease subunit